MQIKYHMLVIGLDEKMHSSYRSGQRMEWRRDFYVWQTTRETSDLVSLLSRCTLPVFICWGGSVWSAVLAVWDAANICPRADNANHLHDGIVQNNTPNMECRYIGMQMICISDVADMKQKQEVIAWLKNCISDIQSWIFTKTTTKR